MKKANGTYYWSVNKDNSKGIFGFETRFNFTDFTRQII